MYHKIYLLNKLECYVISEMTQGKESQSEGFQCDQSSAEKLN